MLAPVVISSARQLSHRRDRMNIHALVAVLALSSVLVACGERNDPPIKTSTSAGEYVVQPTLSAPPVAPDRATPPDPTPATHAGPPSVAAPPAPTARDTPAAKPASEMTKAEEASAQPKPGQTDNHFTTSTDGQLKGTQQSPGDTGAAPAK
jgi:type IV secretory pathway VirB10-like protein